MKGKLFKRKLYSQMKEWKDSSNGSTALLIKGARRVGKSTLAASFAQNEYETSISIDFSIASKEILELFNYIHDLDFFFLRLQSITKTSLIHRKSVIIFDEIQLYPKARQAIKHLVADGRYDYIETGSLLSIQKNIKDIVIPSEETRVCLYPMDFEEFLWATNDEQTFPLIKYCFSHLKPLGDEINREIMRRFRLYMLVGGMPQAVNTYLLDNDFSSIDKIKRNILELYIEDFHRIDPSGRASDIFRSIPSELSKNVQRYKIGSVVENGRISRLREILNDMSDSMTVNFSYHVNDPNVGMHLHADYDYFKIFLADTGLFITLAFWDNDYIDNEIYRKIWLDKLPADLGYIYENVVAQLLKSAGNSLYYYTFKKLKKNEEERDKYYEIDFLISRRDKICPIEVKSSGYNTHKSIDEFANKFSSRVSQRYILYTKDIKKERDLIYLPVYMTSLL